MNKVVTINLGGRGYQLEESGYDALRAYLDEASSRLAGDPGRAEIIADLEQAIGEKCDKVLNPHKSVVLTDEIKRIIDEMGPVEGQETGSGEREKKGAPRPSGVPHRFYLSREGAVFAGVCAGLAAYFDVDVTIMRIIFIALTVFTGGFWVLLYIALALLVPYADTAEARAEARGEPFTAEALVQRAKERWSESYERVTGSKWDDLAQGMGTAHEQHLKWRAMRRRERKEWRRNWKAQRYQYRHPNSLIGFILGALGLLWIFALLSLVTSGAIFGWAIPAGVPIWAAMIFLFVAYFAVTGPMKAARYAPYYGDPRYGEDYAWAYTGWDGLVDGLTVLFLIVAFVWAYDSIPQFYALVHHPIGDGLRPFINWIKSL